jgi:AraC-like DNA-binding protein
MIETLSNVDPLSAALMKMRVQSVFSGATDAAGDWALAVPEHTGFKLYFVLRGQAWIEMKVAKTRHFLRSGDCMLVTSGEPLLAASDLSRKKHIKRMTIEEAMPFVRDGVITLNGGGDCQTITVHFQFEGHLPKVVFRGLPPAIHIAADDDGAAALRWTIERIRAEFRGKAVGRALMLNHLAPMILMQILRVHLASAGASSNWLTTLADPRFSKAIEAMHQHSGRAWSLDELARLSGLSRAGFALGFKKKVGMTPGEYLAHWRMQSACEMLRGREELSIATIADSIGYGSESAFSTAFKKIIGCRPGAYRQNRKTQSLKAAGLKEAATKTSVPYEDGLSEKWASRRGHG